MGINKKKSFTNSSLVCPFCNHVDPGWFTEENIDAIPTCTACNLHLMPADLKALLATGRLPENLGIEPENALKSALSIFTILWAYLNTLPGHATAESSVSWDVWNPEDYQDWPVITPDAFFSTFQDSTELGCEGLGNLSEYFPELILVCSNLIWSVKEGVEETEVSLWPKDSMAMLSAGNYQALLDYIEQIREPIFYVPVWVLIDRLLELVLKNPPTLGAKKLFGAEVSLHTMSSPSIHDISYFKESEYYTSKELLQIDSGTELKPFGPDSPKRIYQKPFSGVAIAGPFDTKVKVVSSSIGETKLTLVHEYDFKLLVEAESANQAEAIVRKRFFDTFGFTSMERLGQNFLLDKTRGVDWELDSNTTKESTLFSKLVDLRITPSTEWDGTAWQSSAM